MWKFLLVFTKLLMCGIKFGLDCCQPGLQRVQVGPCSYSPSAEKKSVQIQTICVDFIQHKVNFFMLDNHI